MRSGNFRCQFRLTVFRVFHDFADFRVFPFLAFVMWLVKKDFFARQIFVQQFVGKHVEASLRCRAADGIPKKPSTALSAKANTRESQESWRMLLLILILDFGSQYMCCAHTHTHVYYLKKPIKHTHRGNPDPFAATQQKLLSKQRGVLEKLPTRNTTRCVNGYRLCGMNGKSRKAGKYTYIF